MLTSVSHEVLLLLHSKQTGEAEYRGKGTNTKNLPPYAFLWISQSSVGIATSGPSDEQPNQVWAADITYLKLNHGFVYLVAIIDLFGRKVLSLRISPVMDTQFCEEALREALSRYGVPAIFNTDQGSQFTSYKFIRILKDHHI